MKPFGLRIAFNHRRLGNVIINQGNQQQSANPAILIAHQAHHPLIILTPDPGVAVLRVRDLSLPSLGKHDRARGVPEDDPTMTKDTKENMFENHALNKLISFNIYVDCDCTSIVQKKTEC